MKKGGLVFIVCFSLVLILSTSLTSAALIDFSRWWGDVKVVVGIGEEEGILFSPKKVFSRDIILDEGGETPPSDSSSTCTDADGDLYSVENVPSDCGFDCGGQTCLGGGDCNDNDLFINPGAIEICRDGIDNNCDGNYNDGCFLEEGEVDKCSELDVEVQIIITSMLDWGNIVVLKEGEPIHYNQYFVTPSLVSEKIFLNSETNPIQTVALQADGYIVELIDINLAMGSAIVNINGIKGDLSTNAIIIVAGVWVELQSISFSGGIIHATLRLRNSRQSGNLFNVNWVSKGPSNYLSLSNYFGGYYNFNWPAGEIGNIIMDGRRYSVNISGNPGDHLRDYEIRINWSEGEEKDTFFCYGCRESDSGANYFSGGDVTYVNSKTGNIDTQEEHCRLSFWDDVNQVWGSSEVASCLPNKNFDPENNKEDRCLVLEYSCTANFDSFGTHKVESRECVNGCQDGACLEYRGPCVNSDEYVLDVREELITKGYVELNPLSDGSSIKLNDSCSSGGENVIEQFCSSWEKEGFVSSHYWCGQLDNLSLSLEYTCSDGACVEDVRSCNDTDLFGNLSKLGYLWGNYSDGTFYNLPDYCNGTNSVMQGICNGQTNSPVFWKNSCSSGGKCMDGICINIGCTDNDGQNFFLASYVEGTYENGTRFMANDSCVNDFILEEAICLGDPPMFPGVIENDCRTYGGTCINGACKRKESNHPYLLFNKSELEHIKAKFRGEVSSNINFNYVAAANYLKDVANDYVQNNYIYDNEIPCLWEGGNKSYYYEFSNSSPPDHSDCWYPPWTVITGNIRERIILLSFAGLITENLTYIDEAKSMMLDVSEWQNWTDTSYKNVLPVSLDTTYLSRGTAIGYDLLYDYLSPKEKAKIKSALINKGIIPIYRTQTEHRLDFRAAPNYNIAMVGGMGLAVLSIVGEGHPQEDLWVTHTIERIEEILDGEGEKGAHYEGYTYGSFVTLTFDVIGALKNMGNPEGERLGNHEFVDKLPEFVFTSSNSFAGFPAFGDSATSSRLQWYGNFLYYSRNDHSREGEILWFIDKYNTLNRWDYNAFWGLDEDVLAVEPNVSSNNYNDVGIVILRRGWESNDPFLAFKSSSDIPLYHSHLDANSFVLDYMDYVLIDPGYAPYDPASAREYGVSTLAHNSIIVEGQGQDSVLGGTIDDFYTSESFDYVVGEAASTYPSSLGLISFKRHIIYLKQDPPFFLIFDELDSSKANEYSLLFHSRGDIQLEDDLIVKARLNGKVKIKTFSSGDLNHELIYPMDEMRASDNQYAKITPSVKKDKEYFLSIIYPYDSGEVNVSKDGDLITVDYNGHRDYVHFNPEKTIKTLSNDNIGLFSNALLCTLKKDEVISYLGDCTVSYYCGDGIVRSKEECDDGNTDDRDGCSKSCEIEPGWTCAGEPTSCNSVCGDGLIRGNEECDDKNSRNGDGCSKFCLKEENYFCYDEPSVCNEIMKITDYSFDSNAYIDYYPSIYEDIIIWHAYAGGRWDIYMCDLNLNGQVGGCLANDEKTRVTSNTEGSFRPRIHKNLIVWEFTSSVFGIRMCDLNLNGQNGGCLANDEKTLVTTLDSYNRLPDIDNGIIVWEKENLLTREDIYRCNVSLNGQVGGCLENDQKTLVTKDASYQLHSKINGDIIVWEDGRNGENDIYMCDLNLNGQVGGCLADDTKTLVTEAGKWGYQHDVHGDVITWNGGGKSLHKCNLELNDNMGGCLASDEKIPITGLKQYPNMNTLHERIIVWDGYPYLISMCDLSLDGQVGGCLTGDKQIQITEDTKISRRPQVYENKVIWEMKNPEDPNSNYEIYMTEVLPAINCGDLDLNGIFESTDLTNLINIVHFGEEKPHHWRNGDLNGDGVLTETDIDIMTDSLFVSLLKPTCQPNTYCEATPNGNCVGFNYCTGGELVNTACDICGCPSGSSCPTEKGAKKICLAERESDKGLGTGFAIRNTPRAGKATPPVLDAYASGIGPIPIYDSNPHDGISSIQREKNSLTVDEVIKGITAVPKTIIEGFGKIFSLFN